MHKNSYFNCQGVILKHWRSLTFQYLCHQIECLFYNRLGKHRGEQKTPSSKKKLWIRIVFIWWNWYNGQNKSNSSLWHKENLKYKCYKQQNWVTTNEDFQFVGDFCKDSLLSPQHLQFKGETRQPIWHCMSLPAGGPPSFVDWTQNGLSQPNSLSQEPKSEMENATCVPPVASTTRT